MKNFGLKNTFVGAEKPASPFANMGEWKLERDTLFKETGQASKRFNQFVRNTIRYFYIGGNNNVVLVNDLLRIAHQARGYNKQRLAAYLQECIPHKLEDKAKKDSPPRFGKKVAEYDYLKVDAFLRTHLDWGMFGKEPDPKSFNEEKFVLHVLQTLRKEKKDVRDILYKMQMAQIDWESKQAAKKAAGASR